MKKKKNLVEIPKEEKLKSIELLKNYVEENFEMEIGNLQTEMLFDFISEKIAMNFYNKGIADATDFMVEKSEELCLLIKLDE